MLPQKDPRQTLEEARSYNLPEFTLEPVKIPSRALLEEAKKLILKRLFWSRCDLGTKPQ